MANAAKTGAVYIVRVQHTSHTPCNKHPALPTLLGAGECRRLQQQHRRPLCRDIHIGRAHGQRRARVHVSDIPPAVGLAA